MQTNDMALILAYSRTLFPREFERLSAVYPPRIVMLKMINNHEKEMVKILKMTFQMSREYAIAIEYINKLMEECVGR